MMLLIEDLNLQVQVFETTTPYYGTLTTKPQLEAGSMTQNQPAQQLAYFVAQWAINVIDFRDPDSIMTPFEFDMDPFYSNDGNALNGTWDVDDIVRPTSTAGPAQFDPWTMQNMSAALPDGDEIATWRGLVWGCERPELLITETLAIHDRGTADTNQAANVQPSNTADTYLNDPSSMNPDLTFDQVRRPRGSIVVELFNPNSPLSASQADMLQGTGVPVLSTGGVNLTQYTVGPNGISPVCAWRWPIRLPTMAIPARRCRVRPSILACPCSRPPTSTGSHISLPLTRRARRGR